jgi:hypothetical protein
VFTSASSWEAYSARKELAPDVRRSTMDRTTVTLDAQFDTLDAHVEGVGNAQVAGSPSGMPEFVRETATTWPEPAPVPLPHDEDDMDRVIFAALVSPYV